MLAGRVERHVVMMRMVMMMLQHVQIGQTGVEVAVRAVAGHHQGFGAIQVQICGLGWVGQVATGLLLLLVTLALGERGLANQQVVGFGWRRKQGNVIKNII